jgi:purine-nucleoside phosphorylase
MGTAHIGAEKGQIAEKVLLPGDPLRAKFIAENFLEDAECYNNVRGMLGYTGMYNGKRVSVQGTGMGIPSISIYVDELIHVYGVKRLIRIGTCGAMQEDVKLRDVVIAMTASTDSSINKIRFGGMDFAPCASPELLFPAWEIAAKLGISAKAGNVLTSDTFYSDDPSSMKIWADFGILCAEMETAGLYTLAAKYKVQALSLLTVSDSMITGESCSAEERQISFKQMMKLALEII